MGRFKGGVRKLKMRSMSRLYEYFMSTYIEDLVFEQTYMVDFSRFSWHISASLHSRFE